MSRRAAPPLLVALIALAGCGLITAPRTISPRFFVLNAVAPSGGERSALTIGLGPISLPSYLDRPEMARRVDANQIAYDPEARWAEPLQGNFQRTVAANFVLLLGPTRIEYFPWYRTEKFDVIVTIAVTRFEVQPDDTVLLGARWTVRSGDNLTQVVRETVYTRPAGAPDQNAAALSAVVAELSQEIAAAVQAEVAR
jgi:uncharacterized lipoprotein YmbA